MNKCCIESIEYNTYIRKWRADYHCNMCDDDITLILTFLYDKR